jgi:hypothetical protein
MTKLKFISKEALISFLIIVAFAFGLSQGVQEAAPGQHVTGQITLGQKNDNTDLIEITAPEELSGWTLNPGITNEQKGILHVKAKGSWQIKVSADKATNGYMTEYILSPANGKNGNKEKGTEDGAYVSGGEKLKNSMKVKAEGYNEVDLKDGGVLIDYMDTSQGNKWQSFDIPITFRQEVSLDDMPLPEGHFYHIAINFNPS